MGVRDGRAYRLPRFLLVVGVVVGLLVTGCAAREVQDMSGTTKSEALGMSLQEQYEIAGKRYVALNDRFAELQREIYTGEWEDGGTASEVIPGQGYTYGGALRGDERGNSYVFTMSRYLQAAEPVEVLLEKAARSWEARGWKVKREKIFGDPWFTTTTPEGYWFDVSEGNPGRLSFTGHTPVYWGEQLALARAIGARRDAEQAAGVPGTVIESDPETNHSRFLPGVYIPFPAWDAVAE